MTVPFFNITLINRAVKCFEYRTMFKLFVVETNIIICCGDRFLIDNKQDRW